MTSDLLDINRRSFMKWSGAVAGSAALVGAGTVMLNNPTVSQAAPGDGMADADQTFWSACIVNCGSRCPIRLQVKDGVIKRVLADNTGGDDLWDRQLRACVRGRNTRERVYSENRIKAPLKRREGTKRGEGIWDEISWDEALTIMADKLKYIYDTYSGEAIHHIYGSGVAGSVTRSPWPRLLNLLGGHLAMYGNYSYAQIATCNRFTYGLNSDGGDPNEQTSNSFEDAALHSKLLVLWGNNPQETRMSGGGDLFTSMWAKKQAGLKIIVIDPRYSDSAALLADQWVPIRPGTDAALVAAMTHVMVSEGLHDQEFLDKYVVGFDEEHMPEGIPAGNSYKSYVMGDGPDGIEKSPEWASPITGIPVATIYQLARDIANAKPCNITQGWGPQRHANGENQARAIYALAAITGNIGIHGGGTGGREGRLWRQTKAFPAGTNPIKTTISCYSWTDAIDHGTEMTKTKDGVRGADRLQHGIKCLISHGSAMLASQHSDIRRTREILQDETKCEFIMVSDNMMTASAMLADLVLPDTTSPERWDIAQSEYTGDVAYEIIAEQAIEPLYDIMDSYDQAREVARKLGVEQEFSQGRDRKGWIEWIQAATQEAQPHFPDFDELVKMGVYRYTRPNRETSVPMHKFREDPEANPLTTPSGKVEIFSSELWEMAKTWEFPDAQPGDVITALPEHTDTWEGAVEAKTNTEYPLQLIGHHYKGRAHSTFGDQPHLRAGHPQKLWINMLDAQERGIENDDLVHVTTARGTVEIKAFVTPLVMPGVLSLPQGAWIDPNYETGVDKGGAVNWLTKLHPSPYAKGNPQHTNLANVRKA